MQIALEESFLGSICLPKSPHVLWGFNGTKCCKVCKNVQNEVILDDPWRVHHGLIRKLANEMDEGKRDDVCNVRRSRQFANGEAKFLKE